MEERAYNEMWLADAVESQGVLFAHVVDKYPDVDFEQFIRDWMHSAIRLDIDRGVTRYACSPGMELLRDFVREVNYVMPRGECHMDWDMAFWVGQFYCYSQWYWNIPSPELVKLIPPDLLGTMYPGLHDKALTLAVKEWNPRKY